MENGTTSTFLRPQEVGQERAAKGEGTDDAQLLKRFAANHDGMAFAALVQRHGPMVLGVCRRMLQDAHAAEDAFQATFLVLVRRARSIARPELLGNWLYGVAYRTAVRARQNAARRSAYERQAAPMLAAEPDHEVAWQELKAVLDEELSRLPEKYRSPLVLCYLEGRTNEEAARQLGCPTGSMSGRLAKGRELLRKRLTKRGLLLSAGLLAALLSPGRASAAVPGILAELTVEAAVLFAPINAALPAGVPARVTQLVQQILQSMLTSRLRRAAIVGLLLALMGTGSVLAFESFVPQDSLQTSGAMPCKATSTNSEDEKTTAATESSRGCPNSKK